MKHLSGILVLIVLNACKSNRDYHKLFDQWKYDTTIIQNLPKYDSLRQIIVTNIRCFNFSKGSYTFYYSSEKTKQSSNFSSNLPEPISEKGITIFKDLGEKNIYGFTVTKDTSIEILLKNTHLPEFFLDVRERLIWKPANQEHSQSEFPKKDSVIANRWKYLIWFDKRAEF